MFRNLLMVLAASVLTTVGWLTYIEPGLKPIKVDEKYTEGLKTNVEFERNLLTQKNNFTGKVKIIKEQDKTTIRLENVKQKLSIPACRNVLVLLSLDFDPENSFVLGRLKGTEGNMNYILPPGEDITNYNGVMIWCKSFGTDYAHVEIISPDKKPLFLK